MAKLAELTLRLGFEQIDPVLNRKEIFGVL